MPPSTELTLKDDGDSAGAMDAQLPSSSSSLTLSLSDSGSYNSPGSSSSSAGTGSGTTLITTTPEGLVIREETPSAFMQQVQRASNIVFNAGLVALLRAWANPSPQPDAASAGVPEWYAEEWAQRTRMRSLANRVARDTAAFAAACYLMDGVEAGMRQLRGKQDHYNKVMGGVTAGGLLSLVWYPRDPRARVMLSVGGAAVGFVTHGIEQAGNAVLLQRQKDLEKELLHKPDEQLRTEVNPYYLRALVRAKQEQLQAEARRTAAEAAAAQQRGLPMPPPSGAPPSPPSPLGQAGVPASLYGSSSTSSGSGAAPPSSSSWGSGATPSSQQYGNVRSVDGGGSGGVSHDRGLLVISEEEDGEGEGEH
ncbi:hypothetical protein Agub_g7507 [Astrephomene gubernaculifera]|uniref:Uncharacterized protein n=1 Tax=Astrephomene gubernaculifera TaxID=47775 RepID=A0AAD3HMF1_9CHLO|nr:hypothetical protein Agub_g7507 [Astrephomene gubernaculifera]